ncbi:hypothetical protein NQD34_015240 [Periophthalmus magnuspinnatus]|nr:hypothetical protein NQD34_015240 [Periophthalmus magnuspinnatus]
MQALRKHAPNTSQNMSQKHVPKTRPNLSRVPVCRVKCISAFCPTGKHRGDGNRNSRRVRNYHKRFKGTVCILPPAASQRYYSSEPLGSDQSDQRLLRVKRLDFSFGTGNPNESQVRNVLLSDWNQKTPNYNK